LSSSSSAGEFSASASGPWSSSLSVTIPAGQTASGSFFYRDTRAGSPVLSASASGLSGASQTETVSAAALASIAVSPASATVVTGGTRQFTASGQDQFGNAVGVSSASWSTSVPGGSVSPATGQATTFTAGSSAGSGQVTASVGSVSGSASVTVTAASSAAIRVNAGGATYTDGQGNTWSADCCFSGGMVYSNDVSISGTSDPALYLSQRWNTGPFSYSFSGLAPGSYRVTLKFAEIAYLAPGERQFDVAINGTQVLTNFDVAATAGWNTAVDRSFTVSVGSGGQLTIDFTRGARDNPIVNAVEVVPLSSAGSLSFVSGPQSLTAGQASASMQVGVSAAQPGDVSVALSSSSSAGEFSASASGPWSSSLSVTIPAGQTASGSF